MNKKPIVVGALVLLVAVAAGAWYFNRKPADAQSLVLYGNVDLRQVSLAFNGSERIAKLNVQEGDRVKAGQVLGELDTRTLRLRAAQAEAQIAVQRAGAAAPEDRQPPRGSGAGPRRRGRRAGRCRARRASSWSGCRSIRQTTAGRAVSQQDLDSAQARRKVAQAQLENARKAQQLVVTGPRKEDIAQAQAQLEVARRRARAARPPARRKPSSRRPSMPWCARA